ncbi:hypothetical protein [uncultured Sphaerochaeta sp.]|uniref:hypothetical protein n=1 Tax=uncultured Sphaerochaeta sp. TaxID=886478 RepID=UPI002A0A99EC|nr:hypothetical protein [uncultured Sphaerochaeta sp.]
MNNLEWYTKVKEFCLLSETCKQCPYSLLNEDKEEAPLHCFKNKEALEALSSWLCLPCESIAEGEQENDLEDNQWLKDLINKQFEDDESDDDLFLEEILH